MAYFDLGLASALGPPCFPNSRLWRLHFPYKIGLSERVVEEAERENLYIQAQQQRVVDAVADILKKNGIHLSDSKDINRAVEYHFIDIWDLESFDKRKKEACKILGVLRQHKERSEIFDCIFDKILEYNQ